MKRLGKEKGFFVVLIPPHDITLLFIGEIYKGGDDAITAR
jgi:hypothetical protein